MNASEWAKALIDSNAVSVDKGLDGFGTDDRVNYHFVHEVVFFASLEGTSLSVKEIVARTRAIQQALNLPQSSENAVKSHLHSMKKCIGVSNKHRQRVPDEPHSGRSNRWVSMFGDLTDGSSVLRETNKPYCLRVDLVEYYERRKIERDETQSADWSSNGVDASAYTPKRSRTRRRLTIRGLELSDGDYTRNSVSELSPTSTEPVV